VDIPVSVDVFDRAIEKMAVQSRVDPHLFVIPGRPAASSQVEPGTQRLSESKQSHWVPGSIRKQRGWPRNDEQKTQRALNHEP
jgi:hypothetical protein